LRTRTGFSSSPSPRAASEAADEVLLLEGKEDGPSVGAGPGGLAGEEGVQEGLALGLSQGVARFDGGEAGEAGEEGLEASPLPAQGLLEDLGEEKGVGVEEGGGHEEPHPPGAEGLPAEKRRQSLLPRLQKGFLLGGQGDEEGPGEGLRPLGDPLEEVLVEDALVGGVLVHHVEGVPRLGEEVALPELGEEAEAGQARGRGGA
jgi:hypothetical protein